MSSSSGTSSACAWASADSASEAPVTVASLAAGISRPASASWPCRLTSARRPLRSTASSSSLPRPSRAGTAARSSSMRSTRSTARSGNALRRRPTRHAARRRRAGGRGSKRRSSPRRAASTPSTARSAAAMPSTAITTGLRRRARAGVRARQREGMAQTVAERIEPEVLLERRQCVGERLGDGARPEHRARGRRQGCDRTCLQQVQLARAIDGPLDVLRAAVGAVGPAGEASELAEDRHGRARRIGGTDLTQPTAPIEHAGPAVDLTGHQPVGSAGHGGDDDAVAAAGDRVGTEQHAAPRRVQHRLDQDRHVGVDEAGEACSVGRTEHAVERDRAARPRRRRRGSSRTRRPSTRPRRPHLSTTSARRPGPNRGGRRHATRRQRHRGRAATRRSSAPRRGAPGGRPRGRGRGSPPSPRRGRDDRRPGRRA